MKTILFLLLFVGASFCQELEVYVASWPVIEADILLDGKIVGQTPSQLKLKSGKYKLLAKKEGWIGEEREVVIETSPAFINLSLQMVVKEKEVATEKPLEKVLPKIEEVKVEPKIEEKKKELPVEKIVEKKEEPPAQIVVATKGQSSFLPTKKEDKYATYKLIKKAEDIINKAEEEGAERFSKKSLSLAKKMLGQAKKEVSYEKTKISILEAEKALKETQEKREQYDSGYISGLVKDFGR